MRETGARGLRSIIENALLDVMFELPSRKDVSKCVITKETISKGLKPTLVTSADGIDDSPALAEESAYLALVQRSWPSAHDSGVRPAPETDTDLDTAYRRPDMRAIGLVDRSPDQLRHRQAGAACLVVEDGVLPRRQEDVESLTRCDACVPMHHRVVGHE